MEVLDGDDVEVDRVGRVVSGTGDAVARASAVAPDAHAPGSHDTFRSEMLIRALTHM